MQNTCSLTVYVIPANSSLLVVTFFGGSQKLYVQRKVSTPSPQVFQLSTVLTGSEGQDPWRWKTSQRGSFGKLNSRISLLTS